jgi:signal transduction histidine kinase
VLALVRSAITNNGVSVQTHLAPGLLPLHGDRIQLQQVVMNLILNAIEAMGTVEVPCKLPVSAGLWQQATPRPNVHARYSRIRGRRIGVNKFLRFSRGGNDRARLEGPPGKSRSSFTSYSRSVCLQASPGSSTFATGQFRRQVRPEEA